MLMDTRSQDNVVMAGLERQWPLQHIGHVRTQECERLPDASISALAAYVQRAPDTWQTAADFDLHRPSCAACASPSICLALQSCSSFPVCGESCRLHGALAIILTVLVPSTGIA